MGGDPTHRSLSNALMHSEPIDEFFHRHFDVAENGSEKARTNNFPRMHWNGSYSSIRMLQENVAATGPNAFEAESLKNAYELFSP